MLVAIILVFSYISSHSNSLGYYKEGFEETFTEEENSIDDIGIETGEDEDGIIPATSGINEDAANSNDPSIIMEDDNQYKSVLQYNNNLIANSNNQDLNSNPLNVNNIDGITKNQIPPGQEDLYVLKSSIIAPVCPKTKEGPCCKEKPPPPCPPCARCPEPSFDCKKVPNYSSPNVSQYAPRPVLANFSQFGM